MTGPIIAPVVGTVILGLVQNLHQATHRPLIGAYALARVGHGWEKKKSESFFLNIWRSSQISLEPTRILKQVIYEKCASEWDLQLIFIFLVKILPSARDICGLKLEKGSLINAFHYITNSAIISSRKKPDARP